jgi:hypothetical protein
MGSPITTLPLSDREWIAVGPQDPVTKEETVYALSALIQPPSWVNFVRSTDSGKTWTYHTFAPSPGGATGYTGQLVADDTGFVAFVYEESRGTWLARSEDRGETWKKIAVSRYNLTFANINGLALDGSTLHATWISTGSFAVNYARSEDKGLTWSSPIDITPGGSNMFPWVAARDGKVAIAWYGSGLEEWTNPNSAPAQTRWHVGYSESLDGGITFTEPVHAFEGPVQLGEICTGGLGCMSGRELGDFMQVLILADGRSMIVYGSNRSSPTGAAVLRQVA